MCIWEARFVLPSVHVYVFNFFFCFKPWLLTLGCEQCTQSYFFSNCSVTRPTNLTFQQFFLLKMGLMVLFTHLKIILLQCFSVFSCIQTDPKNLLIPHHSNKAKAHIYLYFQNSLSLSLSLSLCAENPNPRGKLLWLGPSHADSHRSATNSHRFFFFFCRVSPWKVVRQRLIPEELTVGEFSSSLMVPS